MYMYSRQVHIKYGYRVPLVSVRERKLEIQSSQERKTKVLPIGVELIVFDPAGSRTVRGTAQPGLLTFALQISGGRCRRRHTGVRQVGAASFRWRRWLVGAQRWLVGARRWLVGAQR